MRGYLDDQPIAYYDSLTRKMEPLVPWMQKEEEARFQILEWLFEIDLEKLPKLNHQTEGLHIWQVNLGCELKEDRSKGGFLHYGYNGRDFISFDKETLRWVVAHPQAEKVKEKWEDHPGWSHRKKIFLEKKCIEWLQRYQSYQKEALQKIDPPMGKVIRKVVDDSMEILICQAFGFYPKEIQATWRRDGEVCQYETVQRNVAPNSDGTYYVLLSIEIDPKERDHFQCYLEHKGLQEPLVLALKEETGRRRRCRKSFHQERTACPDQNPSQRFPSPPVHNVGEIKSQDLLHPQITSEASYGHQRTWSASKILLSSLHKQGRWKSSLNKSWEQGATKPD